jgi:hypothetical protein
MRDVINSKRNRVLSAQRFALNQSNIDNLNLPRTMKTKLTLILAAALMASCKTTTHHYYHVPETVIELQPFDSCAYLGGEDGKDINQQQYQILEPVPYALADYR